MAPPYQDWNGFMPCLQDMEPDIFKFLPFLELLITGGVPLYLLAAFVEQTVNGQSIFVSVRSKGRRHFDEEHFIGQHKVSHWYMQSFGLWLAL